MDYHRFSQIDLKQIPSPCYLVDEQALENNLKIVDRVQQEANCKILLALKGFSMFSVFPLVRQYLHGISASSLNEARLGKEEFDREVHTYIPAYQAKEFQAVTENSDYLIFNSFNQWRQFKNQIPPHIHCGLRVNPEYSEVAVELYNPCAPRSRLGITLNNFEENLDGITGLHFHCLCEQNADTLVRVLAKVEEKFGHLLKQMKWINLGGGHHITRDDYNVDLLTETIRSLKSRYDLEVYLEPGEAIALHTGVLVTTVLDIIENQGKIAILNTSAEAHMPDVLAMPYHPQIIGADLPDKLPHTYRLAGMTCLAGDVIGDYSFDNPLNIGDILLFTDMAHYTMVKNTTFNGVNLPSIGILKKSGTVEIVRQFDYLDYKSRLS